MTLKQLFFGWRSWSTLGRFLTAATLIFSTALFGDAPMETLYDLREATSLKPFEFKVDTNIAVSMFPVPQDGSVGTNDLDNAITVFTFSRDRMRSKTFFKNAVSQMGGGGQYMPVVSKDVIGFGQTRAFNIANFMDKKFQEISIVVSLHKTIEKVNISDSNKNLFIFEIEEHNPKSDDWKDFERFLRLIDCRETKPVILREIPIGKTKVWEMSGGKLFLSDFMKNELQVFTSSFEPSPHPLVEAINKNKGKVDFVTVVPHQTLPFAILSGGGDRAEYICWDQTFRDESLKSLFGTRPSTLFYSFSPDGNWVVFQQDEPEPKRSYLMPVSERYPNYLGSPILLEGNHFARDHFAWTTNPVSLVGSTQGKLLRYDLTKEGHPECGDMPTYWDYVVEKDLEKLKREKKQGLGLKP